MVIFLDLFVLKCLVFLFLKFVLLVGIHGRREFTSAFIGGLEQNLVLPLNDKLQKINSE